MILGSSGPMFGLKPGGAAANRNEKANKKNDKVGKKARVGKIMPDDKRPSSPGSLWKADGS
ncbi:hypothetical protein BGE01nite_05430 [Brevifollis gellanilyticus]|uniref:Uncharacterized protein n=1 Tax=Brevifollis gellanilyticus TaxID=748831 RepID=A0A512M3F4_9BACT|nr:hypothetical protein BGE01nite_05430 [Brevifollis gellanilyticus]